MEGSPIDDGDFPGSPYYGRSIPQFMLALPEPAVADQYYLFHKFAVGDYFEVIDLHYSIIDMAANSGLGAVTLKNQPIIEGVRLDRGEVTACRHANGRDWWLLQAEVDNNRYHRLLLSPGGVEYMGHQDIGGEVYDGLGQAAFSPDGTRYARFNLISFMFGAYIDIYDFDRCDGTLNNHAQLFYSDGSTAGGLAFSPNSRFLYIPSRNNVFQYDLQADDVEDSKVVVAEYDGHTSPLETSFFMAQLAPDGKIYINSTNGVDVLHVINAPDEKGLACDLQQHSFQLPAINGFSLPNYPYFNLGALPGSPCDTLGLTPVGEPTTYKIEVYPNPFQDILNVELPMPGTLIVSDAQGALRVRQALEQGSNKMSLSGLHAGIYFYEIWESDVLLKSGKLVKVE